MPRILRNYLISFLIIGLFLLAVHLIDRWANERESRAKAPAAATDAASTPAPAASGTAEPPSPAPVAPR